MARSLGAIHCARARKDAVSYTRYATAGDSRSNWLPSLNHVQERVSYAYLERDRAIINQVDLHVGSKLSSLDRTLPRSAFCT